MSWSEPCSCFNKKQNGEYAARGIDLQLFAAEEKTEDPTPRRRREARRKGQVARSQELSSALVLAAGIVAFRYTLPEAAAALYRQTVEILTRWVLLDWSTQVVGDLTWQLAAALFAGFAPLLGALVVVALLGNLGQTGFSIAARPLEERFQAFNPVEGFKRLFSRRSLFELGKGLLKLIGVGVTAYMVLRTSVPTTLRLAEQPFQQAVGIAGGLTWELLMKTGAVLLVTAIGDYAYQRWEFERSLRMSRQELKQELKETEGNPQLRARRRSQQRSMARKRMLAAAAEADVVIVNPTHLAVALGYEEVRDPAPVVLAKGRGYMALRIRQLADENEIPIMEEPIVARTLYRTVEVGQHIPPEMYRAVAEILALVWSMTGREKPAL